MAMPQEGYSWVDVESYVVNERPRLGPQRGRSGTSGLAIRSAGRMIASISAGITEN